VLQMERGCRAQLESLGARLAQRRPIGQPDSPFWAVRGPVVPRSGVSEIVRCRFDLVGSDGSTAIELTEPLGQLEARAIGEVVSVLAEAEALARAGRHVGGYDEFTIDITDAARAKLPPSAGCGPDERIVRLPRNLLVNAKGDIPDRLQPQTS